MGIKVVKIISSNPERGELIVECNDGTKRKFDINRMFNDDIPYGMMKTWECMFKAGEFKNAYVLTGDIVWPGRCEILSSEIENYLEVTNVADICVWKGEH